MSPSKHVATEVTIPQCTIPFIQSPNNHSVQSTMALFADVATTFKHLGNKIAGTEVSKKVGAYTLDEKITGMSTFSFNNIAALTFGLTGQCEEVFGEGE